MHLLDEDAPLHRLAGLLPLSLPSPLLVRGGGGGGGKGGCRGEGRRICCGSPRLVGRGRAHCRINGELADSALWQDGLDVTATLLLGLRLGLRLALQQDKT